MLSLWAHDDAWMVISDGGEEALRERLRLSVSDWSWGGVVIGGILLVADLAGYLLIVGR